MKIAFIGTGNMGGALARAAAKDTDNQLLLVNRHPEKAAQLQRQIGGELADNARAAREAELLVLGVKPRALPELCGELRPLLAGRRPSVTVVSMAAGVSLAELTELLGEGPAIRIMPNTPAAVGAGMILYTCGGGAEPEAFLHALRFAGRFLAVEERLMNTGMALSGCGPAFVDLFVVGGLTREDALLLAAQTVRGAAALILESGKHPGELKDAVCSPGGTTIRGVRKLEERGFCSAVIEAVLAAGDIR